MSVINDEVAVCPFKSFSATIQKLYMFHHIICTKHLAVSNETDALQRACSARERFAPILSAV